MKIVVLGSEGFIGEAVCRSLHARDVRYIPVATSSVGHFKLHEDFGWVRPVVKDADVVYLCAGRTGGVGLMAKDPLAFVYPNVRVQLNVFEACAAMGVKRIVWTQSTTGYPEKNAPLLEEEFLEGDVYPAYFGPGNVARFMKRVSQMFKGMEFVAFRPMNVYGPGNNFDPQNSHVIEATVRKVVERQDPFVIWGSGADKREAIYVDDLADLMAFGIDCPVGDYNACTGEETSVNEMVEILLQHSGFTPARIERDVSKPSAIPARRVNISKARAIGWSPKVMIREGLARTFDWYMAQQVALAQE